MSEWRGRGGVAAELFCRWCERSDGDFTDGRKQKCDECRRVRVCTKCGQARKGTELGRGGVCYACELRSEPAGFWDL